MCDFYSTRIISYWTCTWPHMSKPCTARLGTEPSFRSEDANVLWPVQCKNVAFSILKKKCFCVSVFQPLRVCRYDQDGPGLQHYSSGPGGRAHPAHTGGAHQRADRLAQQGDARSSNDNERAACAEPAPARFRSPATALTRRQILYARDVDQRSTTFEKSLHMGKEFQRRAKAMILRAAVLRNQIHVKVFEWTLLEHVNFLPYFALMFLIFREHIPGYVHGAKSFQRWINKKKKLSSLTFWRKKKLVQD